MYGYAAIRKFKRICEMEDVYINKNHAGEQIVVRVSKRMGACTIERYVRPTLLSNREKKHNGSKDQMETNASIDSE